MGFGEAVQTVLGKYADFSGRARRSECWWYTLAVGVVALVLSVLRTQSGVFSLLFYVLILATVVPSLSVGARRLHDTGRSGLWLLIGLVPLVGAIVLLVFDVQDSQPGDNEHGPNPKGFEGLAPGYAT